MDLDRLDTKILNFLQDDARMSVNLIADRLNITHYTVSKKISMMIENKVFYPKVQLRLRNIGFNAIFHVDIKLRVLDPKDVEMFISRLVGYANVSQIVSVSGDYDLFLVIVSRDGKEYDIIKKKILSENKEFILSWSEKYTSRIYKFEKYDVENLIFQ